MRALAPTALLTLLLLGAVSLSPAPARAQGAVQIRVLSTRADLVSGGEALVEVVAPTGAPLSAVRVDVGGRDVTSELAPGRVAGLLASSPLRNRLPVERDDNALVGLVTGLRVGDNLLTARLPDGSGAAITIVDHPAAGPVVAGPQVQPWVCATQSPPAPPVGAGQPVTLGAALDSQRDTPSVVSWFYRSTDPVACSGQPPCFAPYDPASPPASVPTTTTDEGVTVPYVVRLEAGVEDRGIYAVAVLADPHAPWTPWAPQRTWNHKLVVTFGASTAVDHEQGMPSAVMDQGVSSSNPQGPLNWWSPDSALSRGFMVANSGLNVHGEDANDNVSAEAVMMLEEHIRNTYGLIRYTIGNGCSGGGLQQYIIAAMYPGLLDGIQPNCSFPDVWTTAQEVLDCVLLIHYEQTSSSPLAAATATLADGHRDPSDCAAWQATFGNADNPTTASNCSLPANLVYNASSNPAGVRCDLQDYQGSIWGARPPAVWSAVERRIGAGFAGRPFDNVGVQYGLDALDAGRITVAQFLDLNSAIGGEDIDLAWQRQRSVADPGTVATAYRTGQVADARQLATVPIIDLRAYSESAEIHTSFHSYEMRARLDGANGTHGNQVIWTWPAEFPVLGVTPSPAVALKAFLLMDAWLSRIEADPSAATLAAKVLADRPADAVDACFPDSQATSPEITDSATCSALFPAYADARIEAGGPLTDDVLKCALTPPRQADYAAAFTAAEWQQLLTIFPTGVCDRRRPGVDEQPSTPWMTFASGPGGRPLGPAPTSHAIPASLVAAASTTMPTATPNTTQGPPRGVAMAAIAVGLGAVCLRRRRSRSTQAVRQR